MLVPAKVALGKVALGFCGLAPGYPARRPHAIGRAARVRWRARHPGPYATGSKIYDKSEGVQASRGPLSLLAGNRAKTPGALGYAASEVSPARPRAELGLS